MARMTPTQRVRPAIALTLLATAASADAFWLDAFYSHCEPKVRENRVWPEQYIDADRQRTMAPFDVMTRNGWRRQNLLGEHHFTDDATQLTEAGKLRVRWILTQAPPTYRQVFIERSLDDQTTQARIAAASEFATLVAADGDQPTVTGTHLISDGRPAVTVDFVNTSFRENMPIPALPAVTGASTGGGSSE